MNSHSDLLVILLQTGDFLVRGKDCAVLAAKPYGDFLCCRSGQIFGEVHSQQSGLTGFGGSAFVTHEGRGNANDLANRLNDFREAKDFRAALDELSGEEDVAKPASDARK